MVWCTQYDLTVGEMACSMEQFSEYTLKYPKTWLRKSATPLLFVCMHLHKCVQYINFVSFVQTLRVNVGQVRVKRLDG